MIEIPCLYGWLNGCYPLGNIVFEPTQQVIEEFNGKKLFWLNISRSILAHTVHEAESLPMLRIPESHIEYVSRALYVLGRHPHEFENFRWKIITREERDLILSKIGLPPKYSCPIYLITRKVNGVNTISYVGKTINQRSRFSGGHLALSKLLNPIYDGQEKRIFFCSIHIGFRENYNTNSIDFVSDRILKNLLIDNVEAMLINAYRPELNTVGINPMLPPRRFSIDLTVQNSSTEDVYMPIRQISDEILREGRELIGKGF